MDIGNEKTGFGASSTGLPSRLQYSAPERGAMPPRVGVGPPQSRALASSSSPPGMSAWTHTAPYYLDDHSPAIEVSMPSQQGAHADQEDEHGNTPLMHLVGRGQFEKARRLIDAGADPAHRNHVGDCAVDLAMAQGEFLEAAGLADKAASAASTAVTALLGMLNRRIAVPVNDSTTSSIANTTASVPAASVKSCSMTSMTCKMENACKAVANDDLVVLEHILPTLKRRKQSRPSQQPVTARSGHGRVSIRILKGALLNMAACLGRSSLIPKLLESGALLEHRDADGNTALIHAAHIGNDEIMAMLLARGASMAVRNRKGALLMAVALQNSDDAALRSLSRQALKRRAERRPSVSITMAPTTTYELLSNVFRAVEKKDARSLRRLLAQTSNYRINIKRELGCLHKPDASNNALLKDRMMTPLMLAAFSGDEDSLDLLLDAGAYIAQSDSSGMTALMWAARGGRTAAVQVLLDGGTVNQADASGATALIHAVESRVVACVQALVDAGANVAHAANDGWTALMLAAMCGDTAIIKVLLRGGAKTDQPRPSGRTALHNAARYGHTSSVKALLKAKAGVNLADCYGMTALMYSAERGHIAALRLLLRTGAAIDQINGNGASALMCAADEGQHAAVKVLLEAGANVELEAKDVGYTAMHIAVRRRHVKCIELLRAKGADS